MYSVYVDGQYGTTGLKIRDYLSKHDHIRLLNIAYEERRDMELRKKCMNEADIVFLCLPDQAAEEAVKMVENDKTKVIDASTAHRIDEEWTYGIPELFPHQRAKIRNSKRVSVPGCHATAALLALAPLVGKGIVPANYPVSIYSVTGYSGGGKKVIADYENKKRAPFFAVPRPYALQLDHKHLPELTKYAGLKEKPILLPVICDYYKGLAVSIPLYTNKLSEYKSPEEIRRFLVNYYSEEPFVNIMSNETEGLFEDGSFDITGCNDTNRADLFVLGNEDRIVLMTRLDNLGKGASGAAIQCMNIMLGVPEQTGLN
ncbi:MAG: N-acetyl-gamma-glutamyl-phosphate reductase [Sporolactobacillus sp.]|uniref:N-acetyl-gamma-glutamyl-phosphate reductase n=1 Tax=Sporolactobacillus sp. STSJ-5 TaxID=2965076 RepID=UPI00210668CF|nr:N-acetyl-gamma-glutamyl-phosphate reductase [Sporolactobacillus sp. STSJ-5]MCQ2010995.1 N-acetyl-gamma-glutamyl-phosphate reductase [Sporolactobacillus sp. STSJ-5]